MSKETDKDNTKKAAATQKKKAVTKKAVTKKTASKKKAVAKKAATKKKTAKKTTSRKTTTAVKTRTHAISDRERYHMIATMAYYRAEKRNFAPGNELQDWYECEKIIDSMLKK